jgi:trafficking protein particle complex subunit 11
MEYYTAHSKRVRRKRNKHSHGASVSTGGPFGGGTGRPLRDIGWTVRYEYKLALFAEFRGEQEVSRKYVLIYFYRIRN